MLVREIFIRFFLISFGFAACAQEVRPLPVPPVPEPDGSGWRRITAPYEARPLEPARFADSPRWATLLRAGNLYLSLRDAIALAVENNLDVEWQRQVPRLAETDILRAKAGGGLLRGIPLQVREGPAGVGGARVTEAEGLTPAQGVTPSPTADTGGFGTAFGGAAFGPVALSSGPLVPVLEPVVVGALGWNRSNRPQSNSFLTGADRLSTTTASGDLRLQQGFLTGGQLSFGYDTSRVNANNRRQDINPSSSGGLALTFTQPLLEGFGFAVNRRFQRIARNNRSVADLAFAQQLMATVYGVTRLYWDLASLNEDATVRRQSLELSERLLRDNVEQERAGTLAPIEVVRARAEVARSRRDLTVAETRVLQQETVLKDFLTRGGVDAPAVRSARVILTDPIQAPTAAPVQPLQDLVEQALRRRPEVLQAQRQQESSEIGLTGSRSALLPALDLVVNARSSSLVGQVNALPPLGGTGTGGTTGEALIRQPDPSLIGGTGTGLQQVFSGRFPDYGAEVRLTIPLLNRAARADYARDQLLVRQQDIRRRQVEKQVRVDVVNALVTVEQAQAAYAAAQQARVLQEEALAAEQEKYVAGVSTSYVVIQYQRDLVAARSAEVAALGDFAQARAALERATGGILEAYGVDVEAAYGK